MRCDYAISTDQQANGDRPNDVCNHSNGLCGKRCMLHKRGNPKCILRPSTTLHPMPVHWRYPDTHKPQAVHCCTGQLKSQQRSSVRFIKVKAVLPLVKRHLPHIEEVNYLIGSPSRERTILYLVEHHTKLFELSATWLFFVCGHGKGGGVGAKRC